MDLADLTLDFASVRAGMAEGVTVRAVVAESFRRARAAGPSVFTALADEAAALRQAEHLQDAAGDGAALPLLGLTFAVKDNIHVAGIATTSNCPALSIMPQESALCYTTLVAAGAILVGKNTMDQFATGLNGTRSPEPLCRNAVNADYIPGGSSSGSAVAVARDVVSFSLGSDTGGSGRVPAACNGIVGLKPTLGLVSTRGLLYNSRFFDCVPVFARTCDEAYEILQLIAGYDEQDPFSRPDADRIILSRRPSDERPIGIPRPDQLTFVGDVQAERAFNENIALLRTAGHELREIDISVFLEAGSTVFQSAMVAERLCDYSDVITNHRDAVHPAVLAAIEPGLTYSARDAFLAVYDLKRLQRAATVQMDEISALVVPTVPTIFTIADMLAEPMTRNSIMGTYTYFANPLDLCAISVPGRTRADGLPSALCFLGRATEDGIVRNFAESFELSVSAR
ncbi:amidase [Methylobacterium sp. Leaf91]|nr:amidase [Methylobacterium sp. Leaf91]